MKPALLTVEQLAQQWGVSRRTIYHAIQRGHLGVVKIEGCTRIDPAAVEAYLRAHRSRVAKPVTATTPTRHRVTPLADHLGTDRFLH